MLRGQVQDPSADESEVAYAHGSEEELQVRLLEIARRIGVQSAAGAGDDHAFAAGQALGAFLGVEEGAAGDGDAVDPGLERGGDREVDRKSDVKVKSVSVRVDPGGRRSMKKKTN